MPHILYYLVEIPQIIALGVVVALIRIRNPTHWLAKTPYFFWVFPLIATVGDPFIALFTPFAPSDFFISFLANIPLIPSFYAGFFVAMGLIPQRDARKGP